MVPALSLCSALLTSLGPDNHSCVLHVTHLLLTHLECVDVVLRYGAGRDLPADLNLRLSSMTTGTRPERAERAERAGSALTRVR